MYIADARAALETAVLLPAGCTIGPNPANFIYQKGRSKGGRVHVADFDYDGKRMHLMLACQIMDKPSALSEASKLLRTIVEDAQVSAMAASFEAWLGGACFDGHLPHNLPDTLHWVV